MTDLYFLFWYFVVITEVVISAKGPKCNALLLLFRPSDCDPGSLVTCENLKCLVAVKMHSHFLCHPLFFRADGGAEHGGEAEEPFEAAEDPAVESSIHRRR